MNNTFAFRDHQNKSLGLVCALRDLGWRPASEPDLFLIDFDGPPYHKELIHRFHSHGSRVVVYPHGGTAQICMDIWQPTPEVAGYLAFSPGQAETLEKMGYPSPVHVVGWWWCEQRDPRPVPSDPQRVLFAPIHPLGNGFIHPLHRDANRRAFADLLANFRPEQISVRHYREIEANGLWHVPGVEYHQGALDNSTADIDAADVVVSYGTFAYLAIARGVPTVMYAQDYPHGDGNSEQEWTPARNWDAYAELLRYPVNVVTELRGSERAVADWRTLFIGEQLDARKMAHALERVFEYEAVLA